MYKALQFFSLMKMAFHYGSMLSNPMKLPKDVILWNDEKISFCDPMNLTEEYTLFLVFCTYGAVGQL